MIVTSLALPKELHRRLMIAAVEDNAAAAELIRAAVERYLDVRGEKLSSRRPR
jgi:hypothetical protein